MYVDAKLIKGRIHVSSYDQDGKRKVTTHLPPYVYYYADNHGGHKSIYYDKLKRQNTPIRKSSGLISRRLKAVVYPYSKVM